MTKLLTIIIYATCLLEIVAVNTSSNAEEIKIDMSEYLYITNNKEEIIDKIFNRIKHSKMLRIIKKKSLGKNDNVALLGISNDTKSPGCILFITSKHMLDKKGNTKFCLIEVNMLYCIPDILKSQKANNKLQEITNEFLSSRLCSMRIMLYPAYIYFKSVIYLPSKNSFIPTSTITALINDMVSGWDIYYKMLKNNFDMPSDKHAHMKRVQNIFDEQNKKK